MPADKKNNIAQAVKKRSTIPLEAKIWLTTNELVEYTRLSRTEINRLRIEGTNCAGPIPYVKIGDKVRFRRTEIDEWMEKHAVKSAV